MPPPLEVGSPTHAEDVFLISKVYVAGQKETLLEISYATDDPIFTASELRVISQSLDDMRKGNLYELPTEWADKILDKLSGELDDVD